MRRIAVIINPAAGKDVPLLWHLTTVFAQQGIAWDVYVTKKAGDGTRLAEDALAQNPDAIAVFGGDGTILEVANAVYTTSVPLILLPAGTANVLAKELGIPLSIPDALRIVARPHTTRHLDVAITPQGKPLFLRIEIGIVAAMLQSTSREDKTKRGILAYPVASLDALRSAQPIHFDLRIDDQPHSAAGVAAMIANVGNTGIPGLSIQPNIHAMSGALDMLVLESADVGSLVQVGASALGQADKPKTLRHWKGTTLCVTMNEPQTVIWDDAPITTDRIELTISPHKLAVLI